MAATRHAQGRGHRGDAGELRTRWGRDGGQTAPNGWTPILSLNQAGDAGNGLGPKSLNLGTRRQSNYNPPVCRCMQYIRLTIRYSPSMVDSNYQSIFCSLLRVTLGDRWAPNPSHGLFPYTSKVNHSSMSICPYIQIHQTIPKSLPKLLPRLLKTICRRTSTGAT